MLITALALGFLAGIVCGLLLGRWLPQTMHVEVHLIPGHPDRPDDAADRWKDGK